MMPAFTHVQNDAARMNRILVQLTAAIFLLGMPALVFLAFSGRSLLTVIYGHQYAAAVGPLIVASCASLLNIANAQITTMFYAKGMPQLHRRCVAMMAIAMVILIYPLVKWFGPVGGQLSGLIAIMIGYVFQIERICKLTGLSLSQYRRSFLVSGAISLSVVVICLCAKVLGNWERPIPNILIGMGACLVAYLLAGTIFFGTARNRAGTILGF
jgi:O-antigen/teichoic acid export membrane protein